MTLSVMALAMTSGSAWYGAATMAVFVIGTSPLFTLIGYAANKAASAWKGRLATATGLVVLAAGLSTLNGGLTLIGSPFAAHNLAASFGFGQTAAADASTVTRDNQGRQTGVITVTPGRYQPANLALGCRRADTVVFRSQDAFGSVAALVIPSLGVQTVLPENGDTPIDLGVLQPGRIDYSCAMGMYSGTWSASRRHVARRAGRGWSGHMSASRSNPPGLRTRCRSAMARRSSGMLHSENVHTTVSNEPSANGRACASASWRSTARPSSRARPRARWSIPGARSIPVRSTSMATSSARPSAWEQTQVRASPNRTRSQNRISRS